MTFYINPKKPEYYPVTSGDIVQGSMRINSPKGSDIQRRKKDMVLPPFEITFKEPPVPVWNDDWHFNSGVTP
jgi:hypothetical protein